MESVKLGDLAKDIITGFEGIVQTRTEWLNGCIRIGLQPRDLKDGKPVDSQVFDVEQIEYVGPGVNVTSKRTGGDRPDVKRSADPR